MNLRNLPKFKNSRLDVITLFLCVWILVESTSGKIAWITGAITLTLVVCSYLTVRKTNAAKSNEIEMSLDFIRKAIRHHQTTSILVAIGPAQWEIARQKNRLAEHARLLDLKFKALAPYGGLSTYPRFNSDSAAFAEAGGEQRIRELRKQIDSHQSSYEPDNLSEGFREPWRLNPQLSTDRAFKALREALGEAISEDSPLEEAVALIISQRDNAQHATATRSPWR